MASPGGSGVSGGPPRSGVDIVRNMFDQAQAKPTDAQQQAANLREQTRTQEQTREAPRGTEERPAEGAGREGEARESSRSREAGGEPLVKESDLDAFLSRNSNQQMQRDAGRTLTKPQTLSSMSAQAWGVANSPNTPETARALIHQRQQAQANARGGNAEGNPSARAGTGAPATAARPLPTAPRTPPGGERVAPLLIHYARAYSSGGETAARAFTGRAFNPEGFLSQVQRLIQNQMGPAGQAFAQTQVPVAVQVRGSLVFVKDGKEFRAFRLNKDGSLTELPSEDGGEHTLSPEAEALLGKVLRQKGIHLRKEGGSLKESDKAQQAEAEKMQEGRLQRHEEAVEGELDFETRFALLLHEVLEEGRDLEAGAGADEPSFPVKSDWEAFFARMLKMGNEEKSSKKAMEAVLAMVFRGLFKKEGQGNVLVGDLKYMQDAKAREEKFAQIAVDDERFLKLLAQLKPGQKIDHDQLKAVFGEELSFTELAHIAEQLQMSMADEAGKNVVFNPKGSFDPYSQARIERSILSTRRAPRSTAAGSEGSALPLPPPDPGPQGVPANVFELLGLRERYRGSPRLYTFILYSVILAALGIAVGSFLLKGL